MIIIIVDGFWICMRSVLSGGYMYFLVWNNDLLVIGFIIYIFLLGVNY